MSAEKKTTAEPKRVRAAGCDYRGGKRLVLDIDHETFDQICAHAEREKLSVSAAVRELRYYVAAATTAGWLADPALHILRVGDRS